MSMREADHVLCRTYPRADIQHIQHCADMPGHCRAGFLGRSSKLAQWKIRRRSNVEEA